MKPVSLRYGANVITIHFTAPLYCPSRPLLLQYIQASLVTRNFKLWSVGTVGENHFFNGAGNALSLNAIKNCARSIIAITLGRSKGLCSQGKLLSKHLRKSVKRTEKRITSQIEQESKRVLCSTELEVFKKTIYFLNLGVL